MIDKEDLKLIGTFGVDSGMIWVGDPCYIDKDDKPPFDEWMRFCNAQDKARGKEGGPGSKQYDSGLAIDTKHGDGRYNVYSFRGHSCIIIDFDGVFDDDE